MPSTGVSAGTSTVETSASTPSTTKWNSTVTSVVRDSADAFGADCCRIPTAVAVDDLAVDEHEQSTDQQERHVAVGIHGLHLSCGDTDRDYGQ